MPSMGIPVPKGIPMEKPIVSSLTQKPGFYQRNAFGRDDSMCCRGYILQRSPWDNLYTRKS